MSQYPNYPAPPQPPPQGPQLSPEELLAPARKAGTMMMVVGVLAVVAGLCFAYQANNFDPADLPNPEMQKQMEQQVQAVEAQLGASFRTLMLVIAAVPLLIGAVAGGVGLYVRNGGLAAVVIGIVVAGVMLLGAGFALLAGMIQGAAMGGPVLVVSACFYGVPFVLLVLLMIWLVRAAGAAPRLEEARRRQQARHFRYEERQQAFRREPPPGTYPGPPQQQPPPPPGGGGMGYGLPPAPPQPRPPEQQRPAPPRPEEPTDREGGAL